MIFQYQNINWRDRPNQWGNFDYVQGNMFDRAAKIGIDPEKTEFAMFMWNEGDQRDYSKNRFLGAKSGATYEKNSLSFDGVDDYVSIPNIVSGLSEFTCIFTAKTKTKTTATDGAVLGGWGIGTQILLWFDEGYDVWQGIVGDGVNNIKIEPGLIQPSAKKETVIMTLASDKLSLYVDAKNGGTATNTAFTNIATKTNDLRLGLDTDDGRPFNGVIENFLFIKNQVINADQIAFLSDNPYYLYQPYSPVFYSFPITVGNLLRYHNLNGLGGQGTMTWNPLG